MSLLEKRALPLSADTAGGTYIQAECIGSILNQIHPGFITRIDLVQGLLPVGHRPYLGLQVWNGDPVLGRSLHGMQQLACGRGLRHDLQTGAL